MSNIRLADCVKINANYSTIYTAIVDGQSDTSKTAAVNFVDTFHDMQMSRSAVKSIKKAVNVILYLSRKFHYEAAYKTAAKKHIAGCTTKRHSELRADAAAAKPDKKKDTHLCTFLTLTLPAKQTHTDVELSKFAINPFLTYARKVWKVKYFIWKKELQKNGNLHYHLVTDRYIDAEYLRREWNRLLNRGEVPGCSTPFDYVDRYTARMKALYKNGFDDNAVLKFLDKSPYVAQQTADDVKAFEKKAGREVCGLEYEQIFMRNKFAELERYRKAYNNEIKKDAAERWTNPNSTDISAVTTPKSVSAYVAKYIAKDIEDDPEYCQYLDEVNHYKDLIYFTLRDIAKKQAAEVPVSDSDYYNLDCWKDALRETREKFCPIKGRLWFKSASLTPFITGSFEFITTEINSELQTLIAELRAKSTPSKPLVVYSYGTKEDGTPDKENIICTTLLINIFQLQMMKIGNRYKYPNLVKSWLRFIADCEDYNQQEGDIERHRIKFKDWLIERTKQRYKAA